MVLFLTVFGSMGCSATGGVLLTQPRAANTGTGSLPAVYFPVHDIGGGGPAARLDATLVARRGCLFGITSTGSEYLLLWPRGYTIDPSSTVVSSPAGTVARVGGPLHVGGGAYDAAQEMFVRQHVSSPVPEQCRGDYWLVTETLPPP